MLAPTQTDRLRTAHTALIDPNPDPNPQAEDRVHRIGQTAREVCIQYMLGRGTVDEVIWPLLQRKLRVLGAALEGDEGAATGSAFASTSSSAVPGLAQGLAATVSEGRSGVGREVQGPGPSQPTSLASLQPPPAAAAPLAPAPPPPLGGPLAHPPPVPSAAPAPPVTSPPQARGMTSRFFAATSQPPPISTAELPISMAELPISTVELPISTALSPALSVQIECLMESLASQEDAHGGGAPGGAEVSVGRDEDDDSLGEGGEGGADGEDGDVGDDSGEGEGGDGGVGDGDEAEGPAEAAASAGGEDADRGVAWGVGHEIVDLISDDDELN